MERKSGLEEKSNNYGQLEIVQVEMGWNIHCFCLMLVSDMLEPLPLFGLDHFLNWCLWTTFSKVFKDTSRTHVSWE